jgi:hypothetical protein
MESLTVGVIGKVAAGVDHHDFCYEGVSGNMEKLLCLSLLSLEGGVQSKSRCLIFCICERTCITNLAVSPFSLSMRGELLSTCRVNTCALDHVRTAHEWSFSFREHTS